MHLAMRIGLIAVVLLLVAPAWYAEDKQKEPSAPTIKVDVDLVLVTATVTDPQNRYVTGLSSEHFQIWEDKVEQKIDYFSSEDTAISLGMVFDISGSMEEGLSAARDAAVTFLKRGSPEDEYFLVEFSDRARVAEDFTSDIARLQNHLIFSPAKGRTALLDALYLALAKVKEGRNPRKAVLMITDGEDNHSRYSFSDVKEFAREQDVQLYAIGIVEGGYVDYRRLRMESLGRSLIEELTGLTGGRAFFPDSVYELEDICARIALELSNQYVLGYASTNAAKDGRWRKIHVKVNPPKGFPRLTVRAKAGYYAPSANLTQTTNLTERRP